jgi:hypothetical protein
LERARGERAPEAGSRWQSRENGGGLLVIPRASGVEGALVEGRHPDSWIPVFFDEKAGEAGLALHQQARFRPRCGGARQRVSEATLQARFAVENTASGWRRSEGPSIAAPARTERCSYPRHLRGFGPGVRREVATTPKLERRRQAQLHSGRPQEASAARGRAPTGGPQGSKEARSRIDHSVGCSCRRSVADVGETHLSKRAWGRRKAIAGSAR